MVASPEVGLKDEVPLHPQIRVVAKNMSAVPAHHGVDDCVQEDHAEGEPVGERCS